MRFPIEVQSSDGHAGVFATTSFDRRDVLLSIRGEMQPQPTRYSLQIDEDTHIVPTLEDTSTPKTSTFWRFLNHSCQPSAYVDVEALEVVALRPIEAGEEITLNYNVTEWDMAESFRCLCGAPDCYGHIQGFKHLSPAQQHALLPQAAPHIQHLHEQQPY